MIVLNDSVKIKKIITFIKKNNFYKFYNLKKYFIEEKMGGFFMSFLYFFISFGLVIISIVIVRKKNFIKVIIKLV